jgi:hypothetical protein
MSSEEINKDVNVDSPLGEKEVEDTRYVSADSYYGKSIFPGILRLANIFYLIIAIIVSLAIFISSLFSSLSRGNDIKYGIIIIFVIFIISLIPSIVYSVKYSKMQDIEYNYEKKYNIKDVKKRYNIYRWINVGYTVALFIMTLILFGLNIYNRNQILKS